MKTKTLVTVSMFTGLSVILSMLAISIIPVAPHMKYSPSDVPLIILLVFFGPYHTLIAGIVGSLISNLIFGSGGPIGLVMSQFSNISLILGVTLMDILIKGGIYKKSGLQLNLKKLPASLISGIIVMTIVMTLFNIALTPLYMDIPRSEVLKIIPTVIIPFNLIKGSLNVVISYIMIYYLNKRVKFL